MSQNISPKRIIAIGISLGTGPTLELAIKKNLAGIILISPYTSIFNVLTNKILNYHIDCNIPYIDTFRNIDKIKNLNIPIFLIHGKKDSTIPYSHTVELSQEANKRQILWKALYLELAAHNNIMKLYEKEIYNNILEFINSI